MRGKSVREELKKRSARAAAAKGSAGIVAAIFGDGFVFLPRFEPPISTRDELARALAEGRRSSTPIPRRRGLGWRKRRASANRCGGCMSRI